MSKSPSPTKVGSLLVVNRVNFTPINGLLNGFPWDYFTPISGVISPLLFCAHLVGLELSEAFSQQPDIKLLLMEEILPHFVDSFSYYLQGFIHPRWLFGIFFINSISRLRTDDFAHFRSPCSGQSLLHPEQAYDSVVESFEDRHCDSTWVSGGLDG